MPARILIAITFCLFLGTTGFAQLSESEVIAIYRQAQAYSAAGKFDLAERAYQKILPDTARHWGEGSLQHSSILMALGTLYTQTGRPAQAEPLLRQCLALREKTFGKNHLHVANVLNNLAIMLVESNRPNQAEPLYVRALSIYEKNNEEGRIADSLNNLGNAYMAMGRPEQAEPVIVRSLKIREDRVPPDDEDLGDSVMALGNIHFDTGRPEKALELYARAAKHYDRVDSDHPKRAAALSNQAAVLMELGKFVEAEPIHERSLEIRKQLGETHPQVADSLNNLAVLYVKLGKYDRAEKYLRRVLEIAELGGKEGPDVGQTLVNLAGVYHATERPKEAIDAVRRGTAILEAKLGKDHTEVAHALHESARIEQQAGNKDAAQTAADRARRATQRYVTRILPTLGEREQIRFLKDRDSERLHLVLSLALRNPTDANLLAASVEWLLNAKGLIQQARAQTLLAIRDSAVPGVGDDLRELLDLRRQLAQLTLQGPTPGAEAEHRKNLADLTSKEQDLGTRLQRRGTTVTLPSWVELKQVQTAMPAESVFLDFMRLEVHDFATGKPGAARYVVWILGRAGEPRLVDLGPAKEIDALITQTRKALEAAPDVLKGRGEIEASKVVHEPLRQLSQRLLEPLPADVRKVRRLVISPDANLWLLPWAALPVDEKTYLVEKQALHLVISGREILPREAVGGLATVPVLFSNPDFDAPEQTGPGTLRGLSSDLQLGRIPGLPGTAIEAAVVAEKLEKMLGQAPKALTDQEATCAEFFKIRRPSILGMATHGFFLPGSTSGKDRSEDPLLRCGLLLAGCNKPGNAGRAGVLTGREVLSVDLRGCKLVILSACETGLGDVHQGEGVAGLRQAFQLAGAEAVLSSLWRVPDDETALQMAAFMDALSKGKDRVDALAEAQRMRIAQRRDKLGAAHPLNWAAFTLTGIPGSIR